MSNEAKNSKAILDLREVYLRQDDGSYIRDNLISPDPALGDVSDDEIKYQIAENPDAAPDMSEWDLRKRVLCGPQATPKGLRHCFGVRAVNAGIPLNMVQKWLGHAQLSTTAIYADAVGAEEKAIAARMWS